MGTYGAWDDVPHGDQYYEDAELLDYLPMPVSNKNNSNNGNTTNKAKKNGTGNNNNNSNSNNSKSETVKKPVQVKYAGWVVRRGKSSSREPSWRDSPDLQSMPYDDQAFLEIIARPMAKKTVHDSFNRLSSSQQKIVNSLRDHLVAEEKDSNADWILCGVWPSVKPEGGMFSKAEKIYKFDVIFKRIDKNKSKSIVQSKDGKDKVIDKAGKATAVKESDFLGIVDYDGEPSKKKNVNAGNKGNNNKPKKQQQNDQMFDDTDIFDDFITPMPQTSQRKNNNHNQGFAQHQQFPEEMPPPPFAHPHPQAPPGAIPVGHFSQGQPLFSARHPSQDINPFTPHPGVPDAMPVESPLMHHSEWPPHPPPVHPEDQHHRSYSDTRIARRPSLRRASKTDSRRQDRQIESLQNQVENLTLNLAQMQNAVDDSGGESFYSDDSTFSRPHSPTRSYGTPPSSPGTQFAEMRRYGSVDRRYNGKHNRRPHRSGYRGDNMELVPARSSRYDPSRRPSMSRAQTFDDYPRSMTRAPDPPSRPRLEQRRYSEWGVGGSGVGSEFREREYNRDRRERDGGRDGGRDNGRRASMYGDPRDEEYRRRDERRMGGGSYWD